MYVSLTVAQKTRVTSLDAYKAWTHPTSCSFCIFLFTQVLIISETRREHKLVILEGRAPPQADAGISFPYSR